MNISFTKFNTVKINKDNESHEMTNDQFFGRLNKLVNNEPKSINVGFSDGKYTICYDGLEYDVKYGDSDLTKDCPKKEIISNMDALVKFSNIAKSADYYEELNNEKEMDIKKELLSKVEQCVFDDTLEKTKAIQALREELEKKERIPLDKIFKTFIDINYGVMSELVFCSRFAAGLTGSFLFILVIAGELVLPIWACIISYLAVGDFFSLLCILHCSTDDKVYKGVFASALSILSFPFHLAYNYGKKLNKKLKIHKKIKNISSTIADYSGETKIKVNNKTINNVIELLNDKVDNKEDLVELTLELKDAILSIKDGKVKKEYSVKLYKILDQYFKTVNDDESKNSLLKNQIQGLKIKVDDILKKQEEKEKRVYEYNHMISTIDSKYEDSAPQKSIGAR